MCAKVLAPEKENRDGLVILMLLTEITLITVLREAKLSALPKNGQYPRTVLAL